MGDRTEELEPIKGFEPAGEDDPELVVIAPEDQAASEKARAEAEKPKGVTLTPEDYEALKRAGESGEAVRKGLEGLASRLQPTVVNAPAEMRQPGESDEEFEKRAEEELFKTGHGAKAVREIAVRALAPVLQQLMGMTSEQGRRVIALDPEKGPLLKKYGAEVEEIRKSMSPAERILPSSYDTALDQVVARHRGELDEARINAAVEARLKELGVVPSKATVPAAVSAGEGGGSSGATAAPPRRRTVEVVMTREERTRYERKAEESGVELVDYLRSIGKVRE